MTEIVDDPAVPLLRFSATADREKHGLQVPFSDIEKAAYMIDQALSRRLVPLEVFQHNNYYRAKQAYATHGRLFYIRSFSLVVLSLLPFFEEPEWCSVNIPKGYYCGDAYKYMLSGVRYLQPSTSLVIEFICMIPLAVSLILEHFYKHATFWDKRSTYIKVGLVVAMVLHIIASITKMSWLFLYQSKKVGMYLCVLTTIFFSRSLRNCFRMTLRIGHSVLDTGGLLVAFIFLSAWLANLLFHTSNFEDFSTSLLSLFIMLTTANHPNVWAKTYEENHVTFFFFFIYMVIGFFFLMHLLFALIYNNYKVQLAVEVQEYTATWQRNLRAAFDLLNLQQDGISVPTANSLFIEIGSYRHVDDLGAMVEGILAGLNYKADEKIIFGDFQLLCGRYVRAIEAKAHVGPLADCGSLCCSLGFVETAGYEWLSFIATFSSLVVAILHQNVRGFDSSSMAPELASKSIPSLELLIKFVFGWLFLADLTMRLLSQGIVKFCQKILNCFDFVIILAIICLQISSFWYPSAYDWLPLALVLRSIRFVSLLTYFHRWRLMGRLLICMIRATAPILGFQVCVCLLFSIAGVQIFGGLVFVGKPSLEGSEYAESGLWVYNYNDHGTAMITSFNLCVVNNWYVIMDGYAAATGSAWSRAYFVTFWAIAVTFTLNVVVAFFVGAFTIQLERVEQVRSTSLLATPQSSTEVELGTNGVMGYSGPLSKYDLFEEIVRR